MMASLVAFLTELQSLQCIHWKSNNHLAAALAGETDLDLLVAQDDAQRFRQLVLQYGFKLVISPPAKQFPGVEDYLGFDLATGRLSHLHVYYRLVLGKPFVKNHRLPLEDALLASARRHQSERVMIPTPAWELVVLVARILLKTGTRDLLRPVLDPAPLPQFLQAELAYLTAQVHQGELQAVLAANRVIPSEVVLAFLEAWKAGRLTPLRLFRLRSKLRRALTPYQRSPRWQTTGRYLVRVLQSRWPWGHKVRKRIVTGGVTIAFVGADGAGKSTITADTRRWLSWKLDVRTLYMGTQQPSWISRSAQLPFRIMARLHRLCTARLGENHALTRAMAALRYPLESVHAVALGIDRYRRSRLGRHAADQGTVVLFDRFPLPEVYQAMDGPRIDPSWGPFCEQLARVERRLYQAIAPPDCLIVLQVSPEVALARKPDPTPEKVTAKSTAVRNLQGHGTPHLTHVDADAPLEQVLLQVKRAVWSLL